MHSPRTVGAGLALGAAFVLAYQDVARRLVHAWITHPDYSHGLLIPPLAAYLVWTRRHDLAAAPPRPAIAGLLLTAVSLAGLVAGSAASEEFAASLSMLGTLVGGVLFIWGAAHVRILAFPLLLLLLAIPWPGPVIDPLAFRLQLIASQFGTAILSVSGIPVFRDGNVIVLASTTLQVTEACSGIRSLVSLSAFTLLYGYFCESRVWMRAALLLATPPIAVLTNGLRVAGTGVAAHLAGKEVAESFLHLFSGWLLYVIAVALVVAIHKVVMHATPPDIADAPMPAAQV